MGTNLWGRVLTFLGFEEEEEYVEELVAQEGRAPASAPAREPVQPSRRSFFADELSARRDRRSNLVPIPGGTNGARGVSRVYLWEPASFDEVQKVADYLRAGQMVMVNTEHVDRQLAGRIINFLNGSVYALGGLTHRVSQHVLLFAPDGVEIGKSGPDLSGWDADEEELT